MTVVADDMIELTSFVADIDLLSGAVGGGVTPKRPPRMIRVVTAGSGTLEVVMAASAGVARTLTSVIATEEFHGLFTVITDTTDVSKVRVYW